MTKKKRVVVQSPTKRDYSLLKRLGLSKTAVCCYQSLANDGPAKVTELSERLSLPRTGLYRILDTLAELGFLHKLRHKGVSTVYVARPINQAVDSYFKHQKRSIKPLFGGYEEFAADFNR